MKKLMVLAAVAAMGAMSAKAYWTIDVNDGERTDKVNEVTVTVLTYWTSYDPANYNNLYVLLASDWDGTVASLEKNIYSMTFPGTSTNPQGDPGFALYPEEKRSLSGERTLAFFGDITDEGDGMVVVDAYAPIFTIFADAEKSGYFAFSKEASYRGTVGEDLHLEFYLDANIEDGRPQSFAIPEPTSGLLLLLGMAGLALKRKRA